ncbi:hypothetical protein J2S13_000525 [Oikeobacillus pervagus]|uniref:Uncharacterized protein n=1 Tax=Oikeobacillus pervagus TaxID=1325931 RepID=A0AAJ1SX01_9BACI|nr:DUF6583 family protein [Oikeobacillus pervagus]MDQ0214129.1 hypothetical protein [Oikeobacillus pervagus]
MSNLDGKQPSNKRTLKTTTAKLWTWISIIAVILIAGALYVYFIYFKLTPKELYLYSEAQTFKQASEEFQKKYGEELKLNERLTSEPSSSRYNISGEFTTTEQNPDIEMIQQIIEKMSLELQSDIDPHKNQLQSKITVKMDDAKLADAEIYQSSKQLALRVPFLYSQYLYVNSKDFGDMMRKVDPTYAGPDEYSYNMMKWEDILLSEKEKDHVKETYKQFLLDELKEDNFKLIKGATIQVDDQEVDANKIELNMSEKEVQHFMSAFFEKVSKDEELLKIIQKRYALYYDNLKLSDPMGEFPEPKEFKKELKEEFQKLSKEAKDLSVPSGFASTVWVNKDKVVVKREIEFKAGDLDPVDVKVNTLQVDHNGHHIKSFHTEMKSEEDEELVLSFDKKQKDKNREESKYKVVVKEFGKKVVDGQLNLQSDYQNKDGKKQSKHTFDGEIGGDSFENEKLSFSGTLDDETEINLKKDYMDQKFGIDLTIGTNADEFGLTLDFKGNTKFKEKLNFPKLTENQAVNVSELDEQQLFDLQQEMSGNLEKWLMKFMTNMYLGEGS